jgi:3-dehydroquinate synthase
MRRIRVRALAGGYDVLCGAGSVARAAQRVRRLGGVTGVFILSSPRVWRACGRRVSRHFPGAPVILFGDRERAKRLATVERIARRLVRAGADRGALLVAVGGGVVGDVAGFVAATYQRGVRVVQIPTTLVAQVDAAIGGKTGVNLPEGKNQLGAFWPPALVAADPALLASLPAREIRSGLYEVAKCGVIADRALFTFLERRLPALLGRDARALERAIYAAARVKARIVSRDEREGGLRRVLNFGHTLGHALEAATGYRRFRHGEAVGWGMLAATEIGRRMGRISGDEAARIANLVRRIGPLPAIPRIAPRRLESLLRGDKKAHGGRVRFVLPRGIGRVEVRDDVPPRLVRGVLRDLRRKR